MLLSCLLGFVSVNPTLSFGGIKLPLSESTVMPQRRNSDVSHFDSRGRRRTSIPSVPADAEVIEFASQKKQEKAVVNLRKMNGAA
jgi:hypothetical protein